MDDKIELRIAPAADTLRSLPDEEYVDLAFIDADKPAYPVYYEELLKRLRPNGLHLVDNMLWGGSIVDPTRTTTSRPSRCAAFNDMVAADDRVDSRHAHHRRRPHAAPQALTPAPQRASVSTPPHLADY